jgi:hypothetical protein
MSSELELVNRSNTYANQQIASRFKSFVPKNWLFSVAILWIASASAYDAYWSTFIEKASKSRIQFVIG